MSGGRSSDERERARHERERRRAGVRGDAPPPMPPSDLPPPMPPSDPPPMPPLDSPPPDSPPPTSSALPEVAPTKAPVPPRENRDFIRRRVALAAIALLMLFAAWAAMSVFQPFSGDGKGEGAVKVQIPRGADVAEIGRILAAEKIVNSARVFGWRAAWSGKSSDFKAGPYRLGKNMSYAAVVDQLAEGPNVGVTSITVIEGRSRKEIARQTAEMGIKGDYLAASKAHSSLNPRRYGAPRSVNDLEGFLFPATYELNDDVTADALVAQQLHAFKRNFGQVNMSYARQKNLSVFDVVTIASLIEREVQDSRERKLVAAVIYNRLKQGIPLGIDATTRFEIDNWADPLTNTQLQKDTPYNTRTRRGLPPGPIGSPGLSSLKAAARPARVGYIYYVANPCKPGAHSFSSTSEQFQRDVERYQRARQAAGGKQPSGC